MSIIESPFTPETTRILETNIGYRNDELFDGTDRNLLDVINYETHELGKTDIIDFMVKAYKTDANRLPELQNWAAINFSDIPSNLYAYWMGTLKTIKNYYQDDPNEPITEFLLPRNFKIGSDLGSDGCLIISPTPKSKLSQKFITF